MQRAMTLAGTGVYSVFAYGMGLPRNDKKDKAMSTFIYNQQIKKEAIANWEIVLQNVSDEPEAQNRSIRGRTEETERKPVKVRDCAE